MNLISKQFFIGLVILASGSLMQAQTNWPQWRGPDQNGISEATGLPLRWSLTENIVWKTELPSWSASTPIIWGEKVFITTPTQKPSETEKQKSLRGQGDPGGSGLLLLALDKTNGQVLWQQTLDQKNELHRKQNNASPSPVTNGEHLWVMTGTGILTAFKLDGRKIWQRKLQQEYGPFGQNFGYGSSPLLYKDRLFIQVLHGYKTDDPSYILAIDALSGKTIWHQERPTDAEKESPDAYTTPMLFDYNGVQQLIILGGDYVTGHELQSGEEVWRMAGLNPKKSEYFRTISSPVTAAGIIYAPTRKEPFLAFKAGATGLLPESHLLWKWEETGGPDVPSPLCDGTYLYMVNDVGKATCLDAKSGKLIWGPQQTLKKSIVSASPILADGRLYFVNESGITCVVRSGPAFKLLAVNELDGTYTLSSPAVSGNQIFIRTATHLYCIGKN